MKLSINEATCMKNSSLALDLELAEANGYDFIEIRIDMLRDYLVEHSLQDLKEFFDHHHLKPAGYNSIEDINFATKEQWQQIFEDLDLVGQVSQVIGGDIIVCVPTINKAPVDNQGKIFEDSVEALRKIEKYTRKYHLKIAFEPIGSKSCCVRSMEEAYRIIQEVDLPNVGLVIDAFNLFLFDSWKDIHSLKAISIDKIFCYHIDDSDNLPLQVLDHANRLFPGNGVIPLEEISDQLKKKGYTGICSLELFNPSYWQMDPADVFKIGAEKTQPYL